MKIYRVSSISINLPEGDYNCIGHYRSFPWILSVDNFDMTDDELCDWMDNETPYILQVYDNSIYTDSGNGD